jgi:amidase
MPIEIYVDHTGPMTGTVKDNALLLEVIAGADGYDPRQYSPKVHPYTEALGRGVDGLKVGLVKEGFGLPNSERDVDAKVRKAGELLGKLGAKVTEVSIPWHTLAGALWLPIGVEGLTQTMMWGDGYGLSRPDLYVASLMDFHRGWRQRADEMSETTKLFTLLGTYIRKRHGSRYYGKAMNITRQLIAAYDQVLDAYDLLMMPTTPVKATPLPAAAASREDVVARALEMIANTAPFDISHHPAMAIPCGTSDGLPVSMMLVGKHFDEATIYRAAYAFEQSGDWQSM